MIEWVADHRRHPLTVRVEWTDAASDNSFTCAFGDVGRRATLQHNRVWTGGLVYMCYGTTRDDRMVLANLYDPPENKDDEGMVEEFSIIPLGWITKVTVVGKGVIYARPLPTPTTRAATSRARRPRG